MIYYVLRKLFKSNCKVKIYHHSMCLLMQTAVCKDLWVSPHMDFSRVCYPAIKKAPKCTLILDNALTLILGSLAARQPVPVLPIQAFQGAFLVVLIFTQLSWVLQSDRLQLHSLWLQPTIHFHKECPSRTAKTEGGLLSPAAAHDGRGFYWKGSTYTHI